jgi:oligo-1,6-glucosidase
MKHHWSKEGVVYQIYPRSFQDSNGDGIGDLNGILSRIPYLVDLGVSIVWLSPVYASPNDDNGYDISNYRDIHPDFGTLSDMKRLIQAFHEAGLKLVMDLVVNHTSDEHEWFEKSVARDPAYADFYHWSPVKKNWTSFFGGEAWTYHPVRKEWYLHLFSKKQPDLNWDNPRVRAEVKALMTFWLELGVDGFRCDVINLIAKADGLPNGRFSPILQGKEHYLNHPKIHPYLQELKTDVLSKYDCFTVGETAFTTPEIALGYIAEDIKELDMLFQFDHMTADNFYVKWFLRKYRPMQLKKPLAKWQNGLDGFGWNSLYLENHDQARSVSRFGSPHYRERSAKLLMTMLYFQQGTPYIYQGQEIGMTNADFTELSQYRDIETLNMYSFGTKTLKFSKRRMMKKIKHASRDNARTPMQWSAGPNAGFTTGTPWIGVNGNHQSINVDADIAHPESIRRYVQTIIQLRKLHPVIVYGDYQDLCFRHPKIYAYERKLENHKLLVVCNMTEDFVEIPKAIDMKDAPLLLHNLVEANLSGTLQPFEARVYHIS